MACLTHTCDSCGDTWSNNTPVLRCHCGSPCGQTVWDEGTSQPVRWMRASTPERQEWDRQVQRRAAFWNSQVAAEANNQIHLATIAGNEALAERMSAELFELERDYVVGTLPTIPEPEVDWPAPF